MRTGIERAWGLSRSEGECRIWTGSTTGSGAPRMVIDGKQRDARAVVYEYVHETKVSRMQRMRTTCGNVACVAKEHVSVSGDGQNASDFAIWACPACGSEYELNRAVTDGGFCIGSGNVRHGSRVLRRKV